MRGEHRHQNDFYRRRGFCFPSEVSHPTTDQAWFSQLMEFDMSIAQGVINGIPLHTVRHTLFHLCGCDKDLTQPVCFSTILKIIPYHLSIFAAGNRQLQATREQSYSMSYCIRWSRNLQWNEDLGWQLLLWVSLPNTHTLNKNWEGSLAFAIIYNF